MNESEIRRCLTIIEMEHAGYFSAHELPDGSNDRVKVWLEFFGHMDGQLVASAVRKILQSSKWPPKIAEINEAIATIALGPLNLMEVQDAWNIACAAVSAAFPNNPAALEALPDEIREAVATVGAHEIRHSTNPEALFKKFSSVYCSRKQQMAERVIETGTAPTLPALEAPAQPKLEAPAQFNGAGEILEDEVSPLEHKRLSGKFSKLLREAGF